MTKLIPIESKQHTQKNSLRLLLSYFFIKILLLAWETKGDLDKYQKLFNAFLFSEHLQKNSVMLACFTFSLTNITERFVYLDGVT